MAGTAHTGVLNLELHETGLMFSLAVRFAGEVTVRTGHPGLTVLALKHDFNMRMIRSIDVMDTGRAVDALVPSLRLEPGPGFEGILKKLRRVGAYAGLLQVLRSNRLIVLEPFISQIAIRSVVTLTALEISVVVLQNADLPCEAAQTHVDDLNRSGGFAADGLLIEVLPAVFAGHGFDQGRKNDAGLGGMRVMAEIAVEARLNLFQHRDHRT